MQRSHVAGAQWVGFIRLGAVLFTVIGLLGLAANPALAQSPVSIGGAWFRYLLPSIPAGAYMTLSNASSRPIVLTGASSPGCGTLMLHRTISSGGTERMVGVPDVTIPAHGSFRFAPDGFHMMCMKPRMRVGENVPVTLTFSDSGSLTAQFPVYGASHSAP